MIKQLKQITALMTGLAMILIAGQACAKNQPALESIQAFGLASRPFVNNTINGKVCYVDVAKNKLQRINKIVSQQKTITSKQLLQYRRQFQAILHSSTCGYQAKSLGITKLPAIVINGRYVIYGELNIAEAVGQYQKALKQPKGKTNEQMD